MKEDGGKLYERFRREVSDCKDKYTPSFAPLELNYNPFSEGVPESEPEMIIQNWVCHSKPVGKNGFAVFVFQGNSKI